MSIPILPFAVWSSGTNQNSIPANDNSLRNQILNGNVISQAVTAQPASPAEGDAYIIASTHTGAQWSTFTPKDLAIYSGGTWYAFAPVEGIVVNVAGSLYKFASGSWASAGGGGGSVAGSDKQIQYNASGAFGAEAGFEYDYTSNTLTVQNATYSGLALTAASATGGAGFRLPHGAAPTSPTNGDVWTTTAGLYARINGATVGPFGAGGGMSNPLTTTGDIIYSSSGTTAARLGIGSTNQVLTVIGGVPVWQTPSGGGSLTNWTESVNSTAPNNVVPVVSFAATNAASKVDAAILTKGGGAILAQIPDNTSTGGNKRGTRGVDLQQSRTTNTMVASGQESVIPGGVNNTASSAQCFAMGDTSTASGNAATAFGMTNTASGYASGCWGGGNNTADGQRSLTLGGQYQGTRGLTGIVTFGHAGSIVATSAKRQGELYAWSANTSSATPTVLTQDGTSASAVNQVILANSSCVVIQGQVAARQNTTGDTKGWIFSAVVKRGASAAATALVGTPTVTVVGADAGASAWTLAIAADTTNGGIALQITGEASKTINWVGSGMTAYLAN
jgi:hypothetical protein